MVEQLRSRAKQARERGEKYRAWGFYEQAWEKLPEGTGAAARTELAGEIFDFAEECLGTLAPETVLAASWLNVAAGGEEARAHRALGWWDSSAARDLWESGDREAAFDQAVRAEQQLSEATRLDRRDGDAWGTLGGVRRRLGAWAEKLGRTDEARRYGEGALDAYQEGSKTGNPYPTLSFLEERAIHDGGEIVRSVEERDRLATALRHRKEQFDAEKDRPWPAFDLARGRHYLAPGNDHAFWADLRSAVEQAIQVSRNPQDRGAIKTNLDVMIRLREAKAKVSGLVEACDILADALVDDEAFLAGTWLSPVKPLTDLRALDARFELLRQRLERSDRQARETAQAIWKELAAIADAQRVELDEKEQAKLDAAIKDLEQSSMWPEEKVIRFIWKNAGGEILKELLSAVVPGAGLLAKVLAALGKAAGAG